jgi:hypothetical protein
MLRDSPGCSGFAFFRSWYTAGDGGDEWNLDNAPIAKQNAMQEHSPVICRQINFIG